MTVESVPGAHEHGEAQALVDRAYMSIIRTNRLRGTAYVCIYRGHLFGFRWRFSWRRKTEFFGRFGAGWNWKLGVQAGSGSVLFGFVVAELSISRRRR